MVQVRGANGTVRERTEVRAATCDEWRAAAGSHEECSAVAMRRRRAAAPRLPPPRRTREEAAYACLRGTPAMPAMTPICERDDAARRRRRAREERDVLRVEFAAIGEIHVLPPDAEKSSSVSPCRRRYARATRRAQHTRVRGRSAAVSDEALRCDSRRV